MAELSLRPFQQKDQAKCCMLFAEGMLEMLPTLSTIGFYTYLPYALAFLVSVVLLRWSILDGLVYLGIYAILIALFHLYSSWDLRNYIKSCLNSDLQDIGGYYNNGSCMFVAELDDKVVGMCGVIKKDHHKPGEAELQRMSVSSTIRGRGTGKRLIKVIESFCQEHSYNKLILYTSSHLYSAIGLYKKCGFLITERKPFIFNKFFQFSIGLETLKLEKDIDNEN